MTITVSPTYCLSCGGRLTTCEVEELIHDYCPACNEERQRQAIPTTSVAIHEGDRVLLIQRADSRDAGRWDLPAGHPEPDEPVHEAAARELEEDTSLRVESAELDLAETFLRTSEGPN